METFQTQDPDQTVALGRRLGGELRRGDCLALVGDLGAGKTALVRGLAEGFGCDPSLVSSPTYVLVQEYPGRDGMRFHHIDLYRLADPSGEGAELGIQEMLTEGVVVVEWADRAADLLPENHRRITLKATGESDREIRVS